MFTVEVLFQEKVWKLLPVSKKCLKLISIYGNVKTLDKNFNFNSKPKNLNFKGFVSYKKITKILQTYKILLMHIKKKLMYS